MAPCPSSLSKSITSENLSCQGTPGRVLRCCGYRPDELPFSKQEEVSMSRGKICNGCALSLALAVQGWRNFRADAHRRECGRSQMQMDMSISRPGRSFLSRVCAKPPIPAADPKAFPDPLNRNVYAGGQNQACPLSAAMLLLLRPKCRAKACDCYASSMVRSAISARGGISPCQLTQKERRQADWTAIIHGD
jgi:hypothetical protein